MSMGCFEMHKEAHVQLSGSVEGYCRIKLLQENRTGLNAGVCDFAYPELAECVDVLGF